MERSQILATMGELKLYGMKTAFDQIITAAVKRQHEPQRVIGDFLAAEVAEKQARSVKYQIAIAKLPLAKDIGDFSFAGTPVNETLVRDLAARGKAVLVISSELSQLLTDADRIVVMADGRIVQETPREAFNDPAPGDDVGERLQYAERKLSQIIQKAHHHV